MITLNGMTLGLHVRRRALLITLLIVSVAVNLAWTAAGRAQVGHPIPTLATYLIDYERSSWLVTAADSHLMDRPLIGAYSSDDETVMRQHMYWAQQAGLGGFVVEWRNERKLNIRLERLAVLAKETEFALSIAYRAENQTRKQIDQDLEALQRIVAPHEIFYPKPRPIWSSSMHPDADPLYWGNSWMHGGRSSRFWSPRLTPTAIASGRPLWMGMFYGRQSIHDRAMGQRLPSPNCVHKCRAWAAYGRDLRLAQSRSWTWTPPAGCDVAWTAHCRACPT